MVKTVEELTKKININSIEKIKSLEEKIDSFLDDNFNPYQNSGMTMSVPDGYSGRVKSEIEKMYNYAGWEIKYNSDQRDGDYLEFKVRGDYKE